MARTRPIKLHIKDGKPSDFRLIGPKGRVLNALKWDGSALELADESVVAEEAENLNVDNEETTPDVIARNKKGETEEDAVERVQADHPGADVEFEDPDTPPPAAPTPDDANTDSDEMTEGTDIVSDLAVDESKTPDAVAEAPDPVDDTKDTDVLSDVVEDVSGESEVPGISESDIVDILADESSPDDNKAEDSESDVDEEKKKKE